MVCKTFGKGSSEFLAKTEQPVNKRESIRRSIQPTYSGTTTGLSDEEDELVVRKKSKEIEIEMSNEYSSCFGAFWSNEGPIWNSVTES